MAKLKNDFLILPLVIRFIISDYMNVELCGKNVFVAFNKDIFICLPDWQITYIKWHFIILSLWVLYKLAPSLLELIFILLNRLRIKMEL